MNFQNNFYKINITPKNIPDKNETHRLLQGKKCQINFLEIGLPIRGIYEYAENILHIFWTSDVINAIEKEDGNIFVETLNTFYKFEKLEN